MYRAVKKCQNPTFKVNFIWQKSSESFNFLFKALFIEKHQFRSTFFAFVLLLFFDKFNLWNTSFSKMMPYFWRFGTQHNDLFRVCWFVAKNIAIFLSSPWKFNNPNCYVEYILTTRGQNGYSLVTIYQTHTKKHFTGQLCLFWSHFPKNFATTLSTLSYSLSTMAFP